MSIRSVRLILIRHAPTTAGGTLCGRTDIGAEIDPAAIAPLASAMTDIGTVVTSPARRCQMTAHAIWPGLEVTAQDPKLWEQDFGDHDGLEYGDLPDLGPLSSKDLAAYRPPNGESFEDVCARCQPALRKHAATAYDVGRDAALVVHAGVIRAALAMVLGNVPAGLAFEIDNLSVTTLRVGPQGPVSVKSVNRVWL